MKTLTAFVVEDIPEALEMLCNDLEKHHPVLTLIGRATSVVAAAKQLQIKQPDILFLDIMLGDGTGFDVLELVPNLNSKVIFITASDEYAIKAFKFSAIDYILKPYSLEDLSISIQKATSQITPKQDQIDVLKEIIKNPYHKPSKISLHTSERVIIVEIDDIIRCQSDNNYTTFHLKNEQKILVSKTLKYYANILISLGFIRSHQSHLVNKKYIKEFVKSDGGYLVLNNHFNVPVSARKRSEILEILKEI